MKVLSLPPLGGEYRFSEPSYELDPTNSYLIVSNQNNAAITDAPCSVDLILNYLKDRNLTLKKILITHAHCEHIFALKELAERTGAEVYIHKSEKDLLKDTSLNSVDFMHMLDYEPYEGPLNLTSDGDIITLDEVEIKVMHVPGHSSGSVFYITENAIFSGDVLSHNAVGHHNFFGADRAKMHESLEKIRTISGDYNVYPAHWTTTTFHEELEGNLSELPIIRLSATVTLGGKK